MAINQNHLFEELNGIKCAIVEKNATKDRVEFLKSLLEFNRYTVVVVASPPPKVSQPATAKPAIPDEEPTTEAVSPPLPTTFTIGVTDVMFNPVNAIFGRLLRTKDGHVITLAYWQQKENVSHDEVPYFYKNR